MIRNSLLNIGGTFLRLIVNLLSIRYLIYFMGESKYGVWLFILAFINIAAIGESSLSGTVLHFSAKEQGLDKKMLLPNTLIAIYYLCMIFIGLGTVILIIGLFIFLPNQYNITFSQQVEIKHCFYAAFPLIISRLLLNIGWGIIQGLNKYQKFNILLTLYTIIQVIGIVFLAYEQQPIVYFVYWQLFVTLIFILLLLPEIIQLNKQYYAKYSPEQFKTVGKYSIMTFTGSIGSLFFGQFDRLIVAFFIGPTSLALYGTFTSIVSQINIFSASAVQPLLTQLSYLNKNNSFVIQTIKKYFNTNILIVLILGTICWSLSHFFLPILVHRDITDIEYRYFYELITIYVIYSLNATGYYILLAKNKVLIFSSIQMYAGVFSLLLISIGSYKYGIQGAIWGNIGYWNVILLTYFGMNTIPIHIHVWLNWIKIPIVCFIFFIIINLSIPLNILSSSILSIIYVSILIFWFYKNN